MKYYFIGIGGISMSGLAQFLHELGDQVLGSDIVANEMVKTLRKKGIKINVPQSAQNIDSSIDEVIYTSAITPGSPGDAELAKAKRLAIKTTKRAQKIGELTKKYKTLAISGTHGKSTTTAMVLQIMLAAKLDPSALLGSNFDLINSNYRLGRGEYLVIESDEFDLSFHNFYVDFGAILNLEADHLDYFKRGLEEIKEAFALYIENNFKTEGGLIYNADDKNLADVLSRIKRDDLKLISFGKKAYYSLEKIKLNLLVPGEHNRMNALAALALAEAAGVPRDVAKKALAKFEGASRRFDFKGEKDGIGVYDDYAHHPSEVKATLTAAREKFPKKKIIAVFQPHQYSRTKFFALEFAAAFEEADLVFIPPIYEVAGRDEKKEIDNYELAKMIRQNNKKCLATKSFAETVVKLKKTAKPGSIIMVMGAGPVNEIAVQFLK